MNPVVLAVIAVALILVNGFFVAVEFSLMAARRGLIEEDAERDRFGARSALKGMRSINLQLAASQLGISVGSLLLGWLIEPVVGHALTAVLDRTPLSERSSSVLGLVIGLGVVAFVHMIVGEMVPKSVALAAPERTVRMLMPVHSIFATVVGPVVVVLHGMARVGTRLVGVEPIDELAQSHTATELEVMVEEAHAVGELDHTEHGLLAGALSYLRVRVGDVMAPVADLVTVPHSATVSEAERLIIDSGHTRLLVVGDDPDQVMGFLHAKDLIHLPPGRGDDPLPAGIVRVALRVGRTDHLGEVSQTMRRVRRHVAVVMEGHSVVGLVTLEDILEAIVGDIQDESDLESSANSAQSPG